MNKQWDVFGEVMYTSSSIGSSSAGTSGGGGGEGTAAAVISPRADVVEPGGTQTTAELTGVETVGTLGLRYHVKPKFDVFGSVSYDNNDASLFPLGMTVRF
jgi:hypothetical protein